MSDLVLLPDVEQLISGFLRDQEEVTDLVDTRVFTVLPTDKQFPMVRVHRFSGAPVFDRPLHLDRAFLQVDCWGGNKESAWELAETCRAVIAARLVGSHPEGVVTSVKFGELVDQPDPAAPTKTGTPRQRFLFTMSVTVHPLRDVGS